MRERGDRGERGERGSATQTYSSVRKPKKGRVEIDPNPSGIPEVITEQFQDQRLEPWLYLNLE